jgi:phosphopantetheinyl transferase
MRVSDKIIMVDSFTGYLFVRFESHSPQAGLANFGFRFFAMSLFYQHNINEDTKLGVWLIEEPESFFLNKVPLKGRVTHFHKRLQHLAGRYLLPVLFEDFPLEEIQIADTRKPFLEKERYHFSISHCGDFAAALVSRTHRVGVDAEIIRPRILTLHPKFLSDSEYELMSGMEAGGENDPGSLLAIRLTFLWSAKESIFKWYGRGGVDFKKNIRLLEARWSQDEMGPEMHFDFTKESQVRLLVKGRLFERLALAWVIS